MKRRVILVLNFDCNLRCKTCRMWRNKNNQFDENNIHLVLENLSTIASDITFTGGEPFLHYDLLLKAISSAKTLFTKIKLDSNNTLTTVKQLEELYEKGLTNYLTSLDGYEGHDLLRGKDTRKLVKKNLEDIIASKNNYPNLYVTVITTLSRYNITEISRQIDELYSLSVDNIVIQPVIFNENAFEFTKKDEVHSRNNLFPTEEQKIDLEELIDKILFYKRKNPKFIRKSEDYYRLIPQFFFSPDFSLECRTHESTIIVNGDGTVRFCSSGSSLGNIIESPINEILSNQKALNEISRIKKCNLCLAPCYYQKYV